ncbi:MAG: hypothetical protein DMG14_28360 [Acidobacteria bacterium]|nr:MAG: hypothetical protein DMG14_28360 [Acidobacteriota bacterium]
MMTSVPLALIALEPQQLEQQLQRQQQQLEQVRRQMEQQQQQLDRMLDVLERRDQQRTVAVCSVEVRRVNGTDVRKVPPNAAAVLPFNLFSVVTRPSDGCLPAEVRITASYLDAADNLVCSGAVEGIAIQTSLTQSINLEIRPWNFREFARWRNEPPQTNSGPKRLVCVNPEGTAETTSEELERVVSARVRATILPAGGGMSTTEIQLNLR